MDKMIAVEVWVLVDGSGNYVAIENRDALKERYEEQVGELDGSEPVRMIRATINVPTPRVAEVVATVPEEPPVGGMQAV